MGGERHSVWSVGVEMQAGAASSRARCVTTGARPLNVGLRDGEVVLADGYLGRTLLTIAVDEEGVLGASRPDGRPVDAKLLGEDGLPIGSHRVFVTVTRACTREEVAADDALLVFIDGGLYGRFEVAPNQRVIVGRSPDCEVTIWSAKLSRRHLSFELDDAGHIIVEALGSAGGVWVEGKLVRRRRFGHEVEVATGAGVLEARTRPR